VHRVEEPQRFDVVALGTMSVTDNLRHFCKGMEIASWYFYDMRKIGLAGAQNLARGSREDIRRRRPTNSRSDARAVWARGLTLCVVFASILGTGAWFVTRTVLEQRERHQIMVDLAKAEQKRFGRLTYALKDGNCRHRSFDNISGQMVRELIQPCDTPMKDPVAMAKDFNWGNR